MILLQYGMQGSASSWLYKTLVYLSNSLGHEQKKLLNQAIGDRHAWGKLSGANFGSIGQGERPFDLKEISTKLDSDDWLVLKTHSNRPESAIDLLTGNKLKVFCSVRDPIDAAWSILNKSIAAREKGLKEFSNITNIDQALAIMGGECLKSLTWRNFKNVFFYDFSEIKHNAQQVVRSICRYLEIEYDQQFIEDHANLRPSNYNEGIIGNGHKNIEYAKILKFYRSMNYTITNNR